MKYDWFIDGARPHRPPYLGASAAYCPETSVFRSFYYYFPVSPSFTERNAPSILPVDQVRTIFTDHAALVHTSRIINGEIQAKKNHSEFAFVLDRLGNPLVKKVARDSNPAHYIASWAVNNTFTGEGTAVVNKYGQVVVTSSQRVPIRRLLSFC